MNTMLVGALVGAVLGLWIKWFSDALPYPPFKGFWWTTFIIVWSAICGAGSVWE